jgi:hypothetical protein
MRVSAAWGSRHFRAKSNAKQAIDINRKVLENQAQAIDFIELSAFSLTLLSFAPGRTDRGQAEFCDAG